MLLAPSWLYLTYLLSLLDVFANSEKPQEGTQRHQNESYTSTGKSQGSTRDDVRVEESLRVSEAEEGSQLF